MLIYHPCFDCYHAIFRMSHILQISNIKPISSETLRILDFYLLFPDEIGKLKFPQNLLSYKKKFKPLGNPYSSLENSNRVFHQIAPFQTAAIQGLATHGLIDINLLHNSENITRTAKPFPANLLEAFSKKNETEKQLVYFLANELALVPLRGPGGLKDRSRLLDHKYDLT